MKKINFEAIWDNLMLATVLSGFVGIFAWYFAMMAKPFVCNICAVAAGV